MVHDVKTRMPITRSVLESTYGHSNGAISRRNLFWICHFLRQIISMAYSITTDPLFPKAVLLRSPRSNSETSWRVQYNMGRMTVSYASPMQPTIYFDQHANLARPDESKLIISSHMSTLLSWADIAPTTVLGICRWELHYPVSMDAGNSIIGSQADVSGNFDVHSLEPFRQM
jgi:hypothetical protein